MIAALLCAPPGARAGPAGVLIGLYLIGNVIRFWNDPNLDFDGPFVVPVGIFLGFIVELLFWKLAFSAGLPPSTGAPGLPDEGGAARDALEAGQAAGLPRRPPGAPRAC